MILPFEIKIAYWLMPLEILVHIEKLVPKLLQAFSSFRFKDEYKLLKVF